MMGVRSARPNARHSTTVTLTFNPAVPPRRGCWPTAAIPGRLWPVRGENPWSRASALHEKRVAGLRPRRGDGVPTARLPDVEPETRFSALRKRGFDANWPEATDKLWLVCV